LGYSLDEAALVAEIDQQHQEEKSLDDEINDVMGQQEQSSMTSSEEEEAANENDVSSAYEPVYAARRASMLTGKEPLYESNR